MKSLALAVTAAAGLLCSAGTADAQFRWRNASSYYYPSYSYSTYSYPTYSYASPTYYGSGVVTSSYYTPGTVVYSDGSYYPSTWSGYSYPSYYSAPGYSGYPSYSSYYPSGVYSNGVYMGGRRIWRW